MLQENSCGHGINNNCNMLGGGINYVTQVGQGGGKHLHYKLIKILRKLVFFIYSRGIGIE